ncbi:sodium/sugar symporter [Sinomicrobium weinanense]|uniref:Sodium/sugar symporter n=1 Tax=Sinomicrobium weinanense TaxID=2842200 RepID=A0A926Q5H8_9FLAO|nr:sodium/sugar symporter [Sinomicrobium weinanense]MBC9798176.1 sodium/sugar symporter [Sinomicrobium weinanense]MBU3122140.1 sodium/sugar symporter [Sinomicrobium weinanense]
MNFSTTDIIIFVGYIIVLAAIGLWLSFKDKQEGAEDYFLASKSLPWWAVGGSLIASNISAEQFIGMSGSGYVVGMAIASYELMAALTLIIVAKFFLPIFIKKGIYTMPQFLEERFDKRVHTGLAIFWVLLFVFVNITSVLYLGALALKTIMGIDMVYGIIGLVIFSATFSIFGGLKAVVWTDVIQVTVLIFGGLLASVLVLNAIGGSTWEGFSMLLERAPEKFDMILDKSHEEYKNLPGISVLIGGMWIANLYYWGNNQYIIQRALGAKSLKEAQKGTAFAAFLKVLLPLIVVIPGIAAFVLDADITKPDEAYPWILDNYVLTGFKGLAFAALISAIGSSLSSMVNSASTIFTMDIYRSLDKTASNKKIVTIGRIVAALSLILGAIVAPLLGNLDQAFQFIQEYTGFISPGVVVVFLFGMFWKRTSANAAFWVVLLSIPLSVALKYFASGIPFMNRMGLSFLILSVIIIGISLLENKTDDPKAISFEKGLFKTSPVFNISAILIMGILAVIYTVWW